MTEQKINQLGDKEIFKAAYLDKTLFEHDGILFSSINLSSALDWLQNIKKLTVKPTDIWLCGYQKSGTTWLSEIVSLIMADGVVDRVLGQPISERVPNIFYNNIKDKQIEWFESLREQRIVSNHLPVKYMPNFDTTNGKLIYIMRNPKDVCVSYYHFHHMLKRLDIKWDQIYNLFFNGNLLNGDWFQHLSDYWLTYGSNHTNVLFVAYEELSADLPAMVRTIARFLGKQFTDETVDTIVNHCSFDTMKDNPMANRSEWMSTPGARFVRNGSVGDWMRHMTDRQSILFDERYGQQLRAIGLRVCDNIDDAQNCMSTTGRIIQSIKN